MTTGRWGLNSMHGGQGEGIISRRILSLLILKDMGVVVCRMLFRRMLCCYDPMFDNGITFTCMAVLLLIGCFRFSLVLYF